MWKYRCKSHLMSLLGSFLLGAAFGWVTYLAYGDTFQVYLQEFAQEAGVNSESFEIVRSLLESPILQSLMTGIVFAGLVNVVMIAQLLSTKSSYAPFVFLILMVVASIPVLLFGIIMLVPAVIVCIYGMVTLRSSLSFQRKQSSVTDDDELVRVYQIHHHLDESVKHVAMECRHNIRKVFAVYILAFVAAVFVLFFVQNMLLLILLFFVFYMSFNYLARYNAGSLAPIRLLLYQNCDPEACASACIYFSMNRKGHVHIDKHIHTLLVQSLIYLDDPQLAMDTLITYPRRDQASTLQYWSLMASIQYLLKDEDGLDRCKEEASKVRMNYGMQGVMVQSSELASIQNKVDLMNGQLNTCKKYYLQALQKAALPFQQVDACYYIGMISFVEQDYSLASMYFQKVIAIGNKMSFVKKAQHFQSKIDAMGVSASPEDY